MGTDGTRARTSYVIPCSAPKRNVRCAAADMYLGTMFRHTLNAARNLADEDGGRVLIMSARYGLLELDAVIDPYDVQINDATAVTAEKLAGQADALGIEWRAEVYTFLPAAYYTRLNDALRTLDVYAQDVYEAAPGIGYQRGVNRCCTV